MSLFDRSIDLSLLLSPTDCAKIILKTNVRCVKVGHHVFHVDPYY